MNVFNYIYWITAYFNKGSYYLLPGCCVIRPSDCPSWSIFHILIIFSETAVLFMNNVGGILYKHSSFRLGPNYLLFGTYDICHLLGKYFSFRLESNDISQKTYPRLSIITSDWLKLSKILSETTNENDLLDSINNMCEVLYINSPFCLELAKTWTILALWLRLQSQWMCYLVQILYVWSSTDSLHGCHSPHDL